MKNAVSGEDFHRIGPLGRFGLVVAMSVPDFVCPLPMQFCFACVDWCGALLVHGLVRSVPCPRHPFLKLNVSTRVCDQGSGQHFPQFGSKARNLILVAAGFGWPFLILMAKRWKQSSFLN